MAAVSLVGSAFGAAGGSVLASVVEFAGLGVLGLAVVLGMSVIGVVAVVVVGVSVIGVDAVVVVGT